MKICSVWDNGEDFGNFVPVAWDGIWYKNWNLLLEGCICLNVLAINFFFCNLTCWRFECFKDLVSHTQQNKICCLWDTNFVELSYLQQVKLWKKKIVAKTFGQIQFHIFVSNNMSWHWNSSKLPISWPLLHTQNLWRHRNYKRLTDWSSKAFFFYNLQVSFDLSLQNIQIICVFSDH